MLGVSRVNLCEHYVYSIVPIYIFIKLYALFHLKGLKITFSIG
jgi:hypothetical protein